ncbi:MAG TPA: RNA polymerase sigma factor [Polyangiales bacterium]|jgi:RNA polymerase sigma-70 factor (ECF subfamily)|nr:RNA polymerase sigma factor [Polyangiales bacterium]
MDSAAGKLTLPAGTASAPVLKPRTFDDLYTQHFDFVWRSLRRLGVAPGLVDDATQDAFIVVHRRLGDLRSDASAKAWLFGIALRVAHDYRRTARRKPAMSADTDTMVSSERSPFESTATAQAGRILERFLSTLDEDRRSVFVLAELEQLSAPEISEALGAGVNTVYSRLRAARERFVEFLEREGGSHG